MYLRGGFDAEEFAVPELAFELLKVFFSTGTGSALIVTNAGEVGFFLRTRWISDGYTELSDVHRVVCTEFTKLDMLDGTEEVTADLGHDHPSVEWRGRTMETVMVDAEKK